MTMYIIFQARVHELWAQWFCFLTAYKCIQYVAALAGVGVTDMHNNIYERKYIIVYIVHLYLHILY